MFSDVGGYVIGNLIGGKKLTKISPNKTISGSVGSFTFSMLPILIYEAIYKFTNDISYRLEDIYLYLIPLCFFLSLVCQCGDLFISYFKRRAKVNDTGTILPGHGGILDRIDGVIFVLPAAFIIKKLFLLWLKKKIAILGSTGSIGKTLLNIISKDRKTAWFDELLKNDAYGEFRGTGVLIFEENEWKISQYNLLLPIPNDYLQKYADEIKKYYAKD